MQRRKIRVLFLVGLGGQEDITLNDWYDFADWLQQRCLAGRTTSITHWEYIDG